MQISIVSSCITTSNNYTRKYKAGAARPLLLLDKQIPKEVNFRYAV